MPYLDEVSRSALRHGCPPISPGDLTYAITKLIDVWLSREKLSYARINTVIGVLECAKLELYRRIAAPYEDRKIAENGDVYDCLPWPPKTS